MIYDLRIIRLKQEVILMKITFLDTCHGVPAADRYCSCTMLEAGGSLYFIDAG